MGITTRNASWVRNSFLLSESDMDDKAIIDFGYTDTVARPYDTSPGGNEVINPLPQFTRHADRKVKSGLGKNTFGLGRFHDENYGQRQQKIYMRFGVPEFTPMTQFFTGFYSYEASLLARTGRSAPGIAYYLGRGVGLAVTIFSLPLLITSIAMEGYRSFMSKESSKFCNFKPAMHLYWNTVGTMVNHYCVDRGIIPRVFTSDENQRLAGENNYSAAELSRFAQILEVFDENGQVDMYRYASLAHRRKKAFMDDLKEQLDRDTGDFRSLSQRYKAIIGGTKAPKRGRTHKEYMELWLADRNGKSETGQEGESAAESQVNTSDVQERDSFWKLLKTELDDGTAFTCFRVNSTGEVSDSFSNSTRKSELEDKINSISSSSRSTNFSASGGKLTGLMTSVTENVGAFVGGIADQFNISGLAVLGGAAFVDIQEHWDSSVGSLASQSYSFSLVSPYGNPLSQLFSMYIPLFMLLAGALPRSTGKQSYTSPPLVQLFDKGKQQTRYGMIDSVTVRRGITNLAFNRNMQAMGIQVDFSVKDLTSVFHIPISEGFSFNPAKGIFDEQTNYTDYMGLLAGLDVEDQIYGFPKLWRSLTRKASNWNTWTNASHIANFIGNGTPLRLGSVLFKGIDS